MSGLEVQNLVVSYGGIVAVHGASLNVEPGEVVALLGANGAGKSSFVNGVCGIVPAKGRITLDGVDIQSRSSFWRMRRGLRQVPEGRRIVVSLSVEENLRLGLDWTAGRKRKQDLLESVYEMFPALLARRSIGGAMLSGGEQQMLAIGRAIIAEPQVLVLDEPSVGLAPRVLHDVMQSIRRIADSGVAVLLAEQAFNAALEISDRGYVLGRGEVATTGRPHELKNDEAVLRTFLGLSAHGSSREPQPTP